VQLFFVLSGFLITGVLLDTKGRGGYFRSFYGRRVLRIFPLYYLLLVVLSFVLPRLGHVPPLLQADPRAMPLAWIYLSNWTLTVPAPIGHCWSLAVEEQFYLVWPFVVAALSAPRLLRFCFVLAALALGFRIGVWTLGLSPEIAYQNTFARMDALALGAAGAILLRDPAAVARWAPGLRRALLVAGVAVAIAAILGLARTGRVTQIAGYSLLAISFALLIVVGVFEQAAGGGRISAALSARPLRLFGKYSYAIYIIHLPLHIFVSKVLLADVVAFRGRRPPPGDPARLRDRDDRRSARAGDAVVSPVREALPQTEAVSSRSASPELACRSAAFRRARSRRRAVSLRPTSARQADGRRGSSGGFRAARSA
jgi:peptidoglycan/LPS O-acetylase OafA/YrhL